MYEYIEKKTSWLVSYKRIQAETACIFTLASVQPLALNAHVRAAERLGQ